MNAAAPLSEQVLDYISHIESAEYWKSILKNYSTDDILSAVLFQLRTGSAEDVSMAAGFIRDLILVAPRLCGGISTLHFRTPTLVAELERLVTSSSWSKRGSAIYTLGKIGASESAAHLRRVRAETQHTDPLMLTRLASEIRWLTCEDEIEWYIANTLTSTCFLTRLAGLEVLNGIRLDPDHERWPLKRDGYAMLLSDPDARVRLNSAFLHEEMQFEATLPWMATRADKRHQRKQLELRRPLSLHDMEIRFNHHLRIDGGDSDTYTVEQLSAFIAASGFV
ncbi:hypothetical protein [Ottowia testudinis]|uniref:HEAT repeat protein n=1 Tax=Ottowia testudinis TaxID=2816950 RepID=A0A975CE65_9BURK|nr:hypothetical protein [Ottowia testudinis]QTD43884.1 hypothetical protein J1M35_12085 [Ottowia testudinis]